MPGRRNIGADGEAVVAHHYERLGWSVLARNWRCREGEIDLIVARDATVAFCEVKTRSSGDYGSPLEAVTPAKAARLRHLAGLWLEAHAMRAEHVRIDLVGVLQDGHGAAEVQHVEAVG